MKIEQALADCLEQIEKKGLTPEECLARYPHLREELAPLLDLALELRVASQVSLSEKSQREMRLRLMNLPLPQKEVQPSFFPRLIWQTARALAIFTIAFLTLGAGLTLASDSAVPGDSLYPIKRTLENMALGLAPSPQAEAALRLSYSERRLQEATTLAQRGEDETAQQLVNEYRGQLEILLQLSAQETGIANLFQERLERQESRLLEVRRNISMENPEAIDQALVTIQDFSGLLQQIQKETSTPFPLATPTFPPVKIAPSLLPITPTLPSVEVTPALSPTPPPSPSPSPTPTPILPLPSVTPLPLPTV